MSTHRAGAVGQRGVTHRSAHPSRGQDRVARAEGQRSRSCGRQRVPSHPHPKSDGEDVWAIQTLAQPTNPLAEFKHRCSKITGGHFPCQRLATSPYHPDPDRSPPLRSTM